MTMMTKPITYYAQNEAIESLIEKYGSSLEVLTRLDKLFFLALITESLSGGNFEVRHAHAHQLDSRFVEDCLQLIQFSDDRALTGLMLAITAQLHDKVYAEDKP